MLLGFANTARKTLVSIYGNKKGETCVSEKKKRLAFTWKGLGLGPEGISAKRVSVRNKTASARSVGAERDGGRNDVRLTVSFWESTLRGKLRGI
jgi:hypothetical protein